MVGFARRLAPLAPSAALAPLAALVPSAALVPLVALALLLVACDRGSDAEVPEEPPSAEAEAVADADTGPPPLAPGGLSAFGVTLPEGAQTVLLDADMMTYRINAPLEAVVAFLEEHAPPHAVERQGRRHQFALEGEPVDVHVYPESGVVRIAVVREVSADAAAVRGDAETEGEEGEGDAADGPRRIVMGEGDGARGAGPVPSAAPTARGATPAAAAPVDVPGARTTRPDFLDRPGGNFSETFMVPSGYLQNVPRGADGYLRIRPTPEQIEGRRNLDGSPARYFVPTNPAAGF